MSLVSHESAIGKADVVCALRAMAYEFATTGLYCDASGIARAMRESGVDCAEEIVCDDELFSAEIQSMCHEYFGRLSAQARLSQPLLEPGAPCALAGGNFCSASHCAARRGLAMDVVG